MDYSKVTSDNVRKLLHKNHVSVRHLSMELDVPSATITAGLKSKNGLSINLLMRISKYFGVTPALLCDPDLDVDALSIQLQDPGIFADNYKALDDHGREVLDFVFKKELERIGKE